MQACHWMREFDLITLEILIFLTWNKKKLLPLFFYSLRLGLVNWRFSLAKILASHWLIAFGLITNPLFVPWQKTQYFLSYRVKCSQPMRSQNFGQTKPSIDKLTIARHCIENTKNSGGPLLVPWKKTQYWLIYRVKFSQPMRSHYFGQTKPSISQSQPTFV